MCNSVHALHVKRQTIRKSHHGGRETRESAPITVQHLAPQRHPASHDHDGHSDHQHHHPSPMTVAHMCYCCPSRRATSVDRPQTRTRSDSGRYPPIHCNRLSIVFPSPPSQRDTDAHYQTSMGKNHPSPSPHSCARVAANPCASPSAQIRRQCSRVETSHFTIPLLRNLYSREV